MLFRSVTPDADPWWAPAQALAGGDRVIIGLGVSGPQIVEGWYGVPWGKPVDRLRDYITIMRKVLVGALNRAGIIQVEQTSDGLAVVEMLAAESYDLVLMDTHLQSLHGLDALRAELLRHAGLEGAGSGRHRSGWRGCWRRR